MTNEEFAKLNGEQLMHTVWVETNGNVIGHCDQTTADILTRWVGHNVVRIDCQNVTIEEKSRQVQRWGD